LHKLYQRERSNRRTGAEVCALIERSLGNPQSFPVLFERTQFIKLAQREGICAPRTEVVRSLDDLTTFSAYSGFPLVLKADGTSGGRGVRIVHSPEEARRAFRELAAPPTLAVSGKRALVNRDLSAFRRCLLRRESVVNAQAAVEGVEATSAIACWNGKVLASLNFQVIQKAQALGHATVVRVIENREMSNAAERVVRRLCLSGLLGLDFILERELDKAQLIEINPRATQVGHLTFGPERDLPAALYAAVSGESIKPAPLATRNETIALFPQEWIRDADSPFFRSGHHDVPWQEPDLVRACVLSRRKQTAWYSKQSETKVFERRSVTAETEAWNSAANDPSSSESGDSGQVLVHNESRSIPNNKPVNRCSLAKEERLFMNSSIEGSQNTSIRFRNA